MADHDLGHYERQLKLMTDVIHDNLLLVDEKENEIAALLADAENSVKGLAKFAQLAGRPGTYAHFKKQVEDARQKYTMARTLPAEGSVLAASEYMSLGWMERVDVGHIDHDVLDEGMDCDEHTQNHYLIQ